MHSVNSKPSDCISKPADENSVMTKTATGIEGLIQLLRESQNIDGLHSRAGTSAERLVELHGTNSEVECQTCHERTDPEPHFEHFRKTRRPPLCECGGFLKPATISFGQNLRPKDLLRAEDAA